MKRQHTLLAIVILVISASTSRAEINQVEMKIGGYLCGM